MAKSVDDPRKQFILTTSGNFFDDSQNDKSCSTEDLKAINDFLDDGGVSVLSVIKDGTKRVYSNKVSHL